MNTELAGGSNVDNIVVAVRVAIKCKRFPCDKFSRKQKGQVQRCLFSAAENFVYPKGNVLIKQTAATEMQLLTFNLH